jgi:hypothetical protein
MTLPAVRDGLVDHLVVVAPDLAQGVEHVERLLGVRPAGGGPHAGWGTHNALLALGPRTYLEVIAPDPGQPPATAPRPFGVDAVTAPRLVSWVVSVPDLDERVAVARAGGVALGAPLAMSRVLPGGATLQWRLSDPALLVEGGLVPTLIGWGGAEHPAVAAPQGCTLLGLGAEHPDPPELVRRLACVGTTMPVARGPVPRLRAVVGTPHGQVPLDG